MELPYPQNRRARRHGRDGRGRPGPRPGRILARRARGSSSRSGSTGPDVPRRPRHGSPPRCPHWKPDVRPLPHVDAIPVPVRADGGTDRHRRGVGEVGGPGGDRHDPALRRRDRDGTEVQTGLLDAETRVVDQHLGDVATESYSIAESQNSAGGDSTAPENAAGTGPAQAPPGTFAEGSTGGRSTLFPSPPTSAAWFRPPCPDPPASSASGSTAAWPRRPVTTTSPVSAPRPGSSSRT
jgi:hypothetical protein